MYSKAVLTGQEKLEPGSVTLDNSAVSTTLGYLTPLGANVALALDSSFEVMTGANDTITADWGLFNVPGGKSMYIVPKGFATFDSCNLLYNVDSSQTEPVFYSLTTSGC